VPHAAGDEVKVALAQHARFVADVERERAARHHSELLVRVAVPIDDAVRRDFHERQLEVLAGVSAREHGAEDGVRPALRGRREEPGHR
jgi:hypothetical protein